VADLLDYGNTQTFAELPVPLRNGAAGNGLATLSGMPTAAPTAAPQIGDVVPGLQHRIAPIPAAVHALRGRITGPVKMIGKIQAAWELTPQELTNLLGYPNELIVAGVLEGKITFRADSDQGDRLRIMYIIHAVLAGLFVETKDEAHWIRSPLHDLEDLSPLQYMMRKRIPGMINIQTFVEQRLANH
jgi:hypothetical protein